MPAADALVLEDAPYSDRRRRVLEGFEGDIEPVPIPWLYRIGLLIVAVTMVALPLVYVGLIFLAGYGVYYHAVYNTTILESVSSKKAAMLLYVGPLFIGSVLVLFMIKPLFARPAKPPVPRSLDPHDEPLVFGFVRRICAAVGAPAPKRIDVDCQINASASFRRGFFSFFGNDLVLTLGMPLVAGLSLQQLAGVIAHEFGHFAQGAGMRLTYVIRSVNHWFLRVVYERDAWDEYLDKAGRFEHLAVLAVVHGARAAVWLTRRVLWALMWVGNVMSCFMLRQMEYDADRYEARLVGAETFETTAVELSNLGVAFQKSLSDLGSSWQEGRLADSVPGLVYNNRRTLDPEILQSIAGSVAEHRTGLLDTHPADIDRIENARREGDAQVFSSELPATALFRDFDGLAASVSLDFYRDQLGDVQPENLQPLDQMIARQAESEAEIAALDRFFQGTTHGLRFFPAEAWERFEAVEGETREKLWESSESLRRVSSAIRDAHVERLGRYAKAEDELIDSLRAQAILEVGMTFKAEDLGVRGTELSDLVAQEEEARRTREQLEPALKKGEEAALDRLLTAVRVLGLEDLPDAEGLRPVAERLPGLLAAGRALGSQRERADDLRRNFSVFMLLVAQLSDQAENEKLFAEVGRLSVELHGDLSALQASLDETVYPFAHAEAGISFGRFLVPDVPDADDLGSVYGATETAIERALEVYHRLMGALALVAETLEGAMGFDILTEVVSGTESPGARSADPTGA